jgi:hypothetical protein
VIRVIKVIVETMGFPDGPVIKVNKAYKAKREIRAIVEISVRQVHKENPVLKVYRVL